MTDKERNAAAMKLIARRSWLAEHAPTCERCQEAHQVQLVDWTATPAMWHCRRCMHAWTKEPAPKQEA